MEERVVERLAALPKLTRIPRSELEWVAAHSRFEKHPVGAILAPRGKKVEHLWVILSGRVVVRVDRGVGPRFVMSWGPGDVTGMLPYSRMAGPPGDNYLEEEGEVLALAVQHFPEMIRECPKFTGYCVHLMLERARTFNASVLHDEKMVSLGKLASGLAHELNNPASAALRGAKQLMEALAESEAADRVLRVAGGNEGAFRRVEAFQESCLVRPSDADLSPTEQAHRQDKAESWLERRGLSMNLAANLVTTPVAFELLDTLVDGLEDNLVEPVVRSALMRCETRLLSRDVEASVVRIHDLVSTVKRFTYMDDLAAPEFVEVEAGLRDTFGIMAPKAKLKEVSIELDVESSVPRVHASGAELNQVWLSLIDNALDAVERGGQVRVVVRAGVDRVIVRIVDDGPGIPEDILPFIFDPFFTTKPPGHGMGLGLEIARRLVRRYHGDITAKSRPNHTEFDVSLLSE